MSSITHAQAKRYLRAAADGLLRESQRALLNAHLSGCGSCRAEADELNALEARLKTNFQAKWNVQDGPSKNVMANIHSRSRRIIMTNRINTGLRTLSNLFILVIAVLGLIYIIQNTKNMAASPIAASPTAPAPGTLSIDPKSCKPFSDTGFNLQPSNQLYGHDLIQGTSAVDGDFSFEFWLYCDPSLKPDDTNHFSAITGLGIYAAWRYTGTKVEGVSQDYFGFEPNIRAGTSWNGPLFKSFADGKFGIDLSEKIIKQNIQNGSSFDFHVMVDSPLGQKSAVFSFNLEPSERGYKIVNLHGEHLAPPYNGLIAFNSEKSGNSEIYTMHGDGSNVINLTNNPANDYGPVWSPDGKKIIFGSERSGNADIFVMNSDGSGLVQLTDNPGYDGFYSWSPDGQKIVYDSNSGSEPNADYHLMVMNPDGSNKVDLTKEIGASSFLSWSPDGKKIIFYKDTKIYSVDVDGTHQRKWALEMAGISQWQDPQHVLGIIETIPGDLPVWSIYRYAIDENSSVKLASYGNPIVAVFEKTYIVETRNSLLWYSSDEGAHAALSLWNFDEICKTPGDPYIEETNYVISPDKKYSFASVYCPENTVSFFLMNENGTEIHQLGMSITNTNTPPGDINWSSDGKYVIVTIPSSDSRNADIYLFDIERMLNDRSTKPTQLTTDGAYKYGAVWQPIP